MCKLKKYHKTSNTSIDKCMKPLIKWLKMEGFETVACCCGHSKYPMTVIVKNITFGNYYDLFSKVHIPRRRRFYVKDKQGYYYIPEVKKI